ncbi:polyribonucleotide nucleotidyltransferase [candidate division KSB1 bacterium]
MEVRKEVEIGGRVLSIETGKVAKQASGSVLVKYGETIVLVAATVSKNEIEYRGFFPLMVDYREKAYAAGKIPGGFFKRESRPTEKETLSARLIDRPIRSLCPDGFNYETMVSVTVLSSDQENDSDILGIIGASASMMISAIPFDTPIGAVRVGKIDGELIVNPTFQQLPDCKLEIVVTASKDSIIMVEGEAKEISELEMTEALEFAHEEIKKMIPIIEDLQKEVGKEKIVFSEPETDEELFSKVSDLSTPLIKEAIKIKDKLDRYKKIDQVLKEVIENCEEEYPERESEIDRYFGEIKKKMIRGLIVDKSTRLDGRGLTDIRQITCETKLLPRAHGSALFTRGETQSLGVVTLGTKMDEQKLEGLEGTSYKRYTLHYNFPTFCVGETKFPRGPGRREIGHGRLAEKALQYTVPDEEEFPYTIRIVSETLESNGSSSMAAICSGSLAMMDAGVPTKKQTAGIAMGLIKEEDDFYILSDILGDEDHLGDMDFKMAGSKEGFTAIQMDIKVKGISIEIMSKAITQARKGIDHILGEMNKEIDKPRSEMSPYAPKIIILKIDPSLIGTIIGPGGKMIRDIQDRTGATIFIDDDGTVLIGAVDQEGGDNAKKIIDKLIEVPEVGKIYDGKVKKITNFGAFVEILPGKEGLLHISEIENRRIDKVEDVLKVGQDVQVKVKRIEPNGKVDLSRKQLLNKD